MQLCTGATVRVSALKVDSGIKRSLAAPGTRTRVSTAPGFSVGRSTNRANPDPNVLLTAQVTDFRTERERERERVKLLLF